jgi:hypothetical protein
VDEKIVEVDGLDGGCEDEKGGGEPGGGLGKCDGISLH